MTKTLGPVPRARIESRPVTSARFVHRPEITTVYVVLDESGVWGEFSTYEAASERLKTRRAVEKAMRTRRANRDRKEKAMNVIRAKSTPTPTAPRVKGLSTGRLGSIVGWHITDTVARVRWDDGRVQLVGVRNLEELS